MVTLPSENKKNLIVGEDDEWSSYHLLSIRKYDTSHTPACIHVRTEKKKHYSCYIFFNNFVDICIKLTNNKSGKNRVTFII